MKKNNFKILTFPILILFSWWIVTNYNLVSPLFLPKLGEFFSGFIGAIKGDLLIDVWATLQRTFGGLIMASIVGVPLGLLLGYSSKIYESFEFTIEFFRAIPVTALFPLFLLIFGIGDASKIGMITYGAIILIIVNTMHGVHNLRKLRLTAGRLMGLNGTGLFWNIIFPEALPSIITGFRLALSYSLVLAVVTEMFIGSNRGIGYRIINAQLIYDTVGMYIGIISAGLVGFFLNKMVVSFEKKYVHWKGV